MGRSVTIGQYYPADSPIHRLDPRVKLLGTLVFLVTVFFIKNIDSFVLATAFLVLVIVLSRVPFRLMLKGMRAILAILVLTFVLSIFTVPGQPLAHLGALTITREGLRTALYMCMRLFYLVTGASIMTLTTTPAKLTDGMEKGLSPLKKIGVPVHEIAMMMSIALRFIPILIEETDKIMKAQAARGADFESGNFMKRAKAMIPILVPLFVSAFRRANDLALAMEARCYNGGEGRTTMKPLKYNSRDIRAYIITFIYMALLIIVNKIAKRYLPF